MKEFSIGIAIVLIAAEIYGLINGQGFLDVLPGFLIALALLGSVFFKKGSKEKTK